MLTSVVIVIYSAINCLCLKVHLSSPLSDIEIKLDTVNVRCWGWGWRSGRQGWLLVFSVTISIVSTPSTTDEFHLIFVVALITAVCSVVSVSSIMLSCTLFKLSCLTISDKPNAQTSQIQPNAVFFYFSICVFYLCFLFSMLLQEAVVCEVILVIETLLQSHMKMMCYWEINSSTITVTALL